MSQQKPRQRGGRVLDKATPEQVMGLARNLPLTHSVPGKALEDATPGRLGFLANLFEKENASRAESKRRRLLRQAGFPRARPWRDTTGGMASFPADRGREQLESLEFVDRAEDLVLYGDVGCGKTHRAIAIGMLACQRMIPVRFFTASSLVMRLRKAKDDNRLDAELKSMGPGFCSRPARTATRPAASSSPRTSSPADGATCSATGTWPPRSSTASSTTVGSSASTANPTGTNTPS